MIPPIKVDNYFIALTADPHTGMLYSHTLYHSGPPAEPELTDPTLTEEPPPPYSVAMADPVTSNHNHSPSPHCEVTL